MKILIAGIGDKLRCDDGFGPRVIEELAKIQFPLEVEVVDYGTSVFKVLLDLKDYDLAIFVDIMDKIGRSGEIFMIKPHLDEVEDETIEISPHEVNLEKMLKIARKIRVLPKEVIIIGCQPKSLSDGLKMSPEVEKAVKETVKVILKILKEIGIKFI